MTEQELDERVNRAVDNFMAGYGCCQSVVALSVPRFSASRAYGKAPCSYVASERTAEYYKSRPCAAKVESAARIFANYLKNKKSM